MNKNGFTLIELLAVILILGIISLIAIPGVTGMVEHSKKKAAELNADLYKKEVEKQIAIKMISGTDKDYKNGTFTLEDLGIDNSLDGEKPLNSEIVMYNGEIYFTSFKYKNYTVKCYGEDCRTVSNNDPEIKDNLATKRNAIVSWDGLTDRSQKYFSLQTPVEKDKKYHITFRVLWDVKEVVESEKTRNLFIFGWNAFGQDSYGICRYIVAWVGKYKCNADEILTAQETYGPNSSLFHVDAMYSKGTAVLTDYVVTEVR